MAPLCLGRGSGELLPVHRCHASSMAAICVPPTQFSVFLGLIFFLELAAGILAFVFKDWIRDQLNLFINNNVKAYRDDIDLQNLIDFAQEYVSVGSIMGVMQVMADGHTRDGASSVCAWTNPPKPAEAKEGTFEGLCPRRSQLLLIPQASLVPSPVET